MQSNTATIGQHRVSEQTYMEKTNSHSSEGTLRHHKRSLSADFASEMHQSKLNLKKPDITSSFVTTVFHNKASLNHTLGSEESLHRQIPIQAIGRLPLKRFDSADWMLESSKKESDCSCKVETKVAKVLIDRHNYTTCRFIRTQAGDASK